MQTVVVFITVALLTLPPSRCIPRYERMIGTEQWTSNTSQDIVEQSSSDFDVMPLWRTHVRERKNILLDGALSAILDGCDQLQYYCVVGNPTMPTCIMLHISLPTGYYPQACFFSATSKYSSVQSPVDSIIRANHREK